MKYQEKIGDLFSASEDYYLVHCISADFAMGAGVATEFNKRFDMKRKLMTAYPDYLTEWQNNDADFDCILIGRVFNLITKERYFNLPTYQSLQGSLEAMRVICKEHRVKKLAMPIIGCGLDLLKWGRVSQIIKEVFADSDIEILVYMLG